MSNLRSEIKKDLNPNQKNIFLLEKFRSIRNHSETICKNLQTEDYVVQPIADVSPPKWHLGHTTWFFEKMILQAFDPSYKVFDEMYNYVFNSYYESIGARVIRTDRGNLSRPSVADVYAYRDYVNNAIADFLNKTISKEIEIIFELGLNHEQQHQELLLSDIKYILGHNPLFPELGTDVNENPVATQEKLWTDIPEGIYQIGFEGEGFCFDNELNRHKVYSEGFSICNQLETNSDYLEFINDGGYSNFRFWHAEGWDWVKRTNAQSPLYWHKIDGKDHQYTLNGLVELLPNAPVTHINFYEAFAYASWKKMRLPLESEWEIASEHFNWGSRWEWTSSAYLPYPGFKIAEDATGEYNGKFMVSQMVLRGASIATPENHSRKTYRNFFHPHLQWQFTGIRLAQ